MLDSLEIKACGIRGESLRLTVHYESVTLEGVARCDIVNGSGGRPMLRAKFGHSIKAILDFETYGIRWEAEMP